MKRFLLVAFVFSSLCASLCRTALAQPNIQININDLRTPNSPAFVLLGVTPASVERPTNPKALAMSLFTAIENGGNFALEVAPYWMRDHPELTFNDYYNSGVGETILQTLTISAATSLDLDNASTMSSTASSDSSATGVGASVRFALLKGKPNPEDVDALSGLNEEMLDRFEDLDTAETEQSDASDKLKEAQQAMAGAKHDPVAQAKVQQVIDEQSAALDAATNKIDAANKALTDLAGKAKPAQQRIGDSGHLGFTVNVAGGTAGQFPSGHADDGTFTKSGLWITPGYRTGPSGNVRMEILGVARYLNDQIGTSKNVVDVGARVLLGFTDVLYSKDLSISFEGLERFGVSGGENTDRLAGIIEYQLPEALQLGNAKYLFASFGQDFNEGNGDDRTIALFGFNFSFGQTPQVTFQ